MRHTAGQRYADIGRVVPDLPAPPPIAGEDMRLRVQRAMTGFLQALAAERALALLLDDLHWADGSSLGLLAQLARALRAVRVLVLGAYRDVEVGWQHPLEAALTAPQQTGPLCRAQLVVCSALR